MEHFCRTNKKKFTLPNLHLFEKSKAIAPATPIKKEKKEQSSSSSTKTKTKGLSQKEKDLLAYFKNDPEMHKLYYKKFCRTTLMMTPPAQQHHHLLQNLKICRIHKIHMNCRQRRQEFISWQKSKST